MQKCNCGGAACKGAKAETELGLGLGLVSRWRGIASGGGWQPLVAVGGREDFVWGYAGMGVCCEASAAEPRGDMLARWHAAKQIQKVGRLAVSGWERQRGRDS